MKLYSLAPFNVMCMFSNPSIVDTVAVTIWGGAEGALTIIAASIPVLRMLFNKNPKLAHAELSPSDIQRLREPATSSAPTEDSQLSPSLAKTEFESPTLPMWEEKETRV